MENKKIANKYIIIKKIGQGSFGSIYQGQNQRTNELVAIKIEPLNQKTNLLTNESNFYNFLKDIDGIPNVKWYGKDEINYYMVIPLLGESLQTLRNNKTSFFNLKSISIQILYLLESIHKKGLVHRDIKPDNFLFGLTSNKLYLIDFGLCKFFLKDNKHISIKKTSCLIGSVNYSSINSHEKWELSRRDDLISLGYIMIFLFYGTLDWSSINLNENKEYNQILILESKKNILKKEKLPLFLFSFLEYCYSLKFHEEPNYLFLNNLLKNEK